MSVPRKGPGIYFRIGRSKGVELEPARPDYYIRPYAGFRTLAPFEALLSSLKRTERSTCLKRNDIIALIQVDKKVD